MNFLKTPITDFDDVQEKAKFSFVWKITLSFTICVFGLSLFSYLSDYEFAAFFAMVFFIALLSLLFLKKYAHHFKWVANFLFISVSIIINFSIFAVPDYLHFITALWMVVIILSAFFTLGNLWGVFYAIVNVTSYAIYFNFYLLDTVDLQVIGAGHTLLINSIEFGISMFLIAYVMFQYERLRTELGRLYNEAYKNLEREKYLVEQKNKDITDSILYASHIQQAVLTAEDHIHQHFESSFILFKPRDIVSGDFYWAYKGENKFHLACCDCTGHGVPGAFMSLLNMSLLDEAVIERNISRPDMVLNKVRENIINLLNYKGSKFDGKDGMDAVFCTFDFKENILQVACANNPLWIISNKKVLQEIKPDKMPVGQHYCKETPFSLREYKLNKGDCIYLFSDGYADQFGGTKNKKFMYKQFKELLLQIADQPMEQQKKILNSSFENWKGNGEQIDDVCVMGIKV